MIQIDQIDFIPKLPYTTRAVEELTVDSYGALEGSDEIYVAREYSTPLFCCGVYRASFVSNPYLWLLPCEALTWRHLRELQILFKDLAPPALWAMVKDDPSIRKFAQFFGMAPVKTVNNYLMMER